MPAVATYAFGDASDTLSAIFAVVTGSPRCNGLGSGIGSAGANVALLKATLSNNQYAQVKVSGGVSAGPAVRLNRLGAAYSGYVVLDDTVGGQLFRVDAGSSTEIATWSGTLANDIIRLEANQNILTVKRDRASVITVLATVTDSNYVAGHAGFAITDATALVDDFEAGNLYVKSFQRTPTLRPRAFAPGHVR